MSNKKNEEILGLACIGMCIAIVIGWAWEAITYNSCKFEAGVQYPYKWVENGKEVGVACAKTTYKGSRDVTVYYDGDIMFSGRFSGGSGNIKETFGYTYKTFGDVGICRGSNDGGKTRGVCYR